MKLTGFIGALALLIGLFSSCQKEIDGSIVGGSDSTVNTNPSLVKTYSEETVFTNLPEFNQKDSFKLTYDNENRLTSLVSFDTINGFKMVYHYGATSFTLDQTSDVDSPLHEIVYLNSNAFIDSTFQFNEGDTTTEKYIYNADKQVVKILEYEYTAATGGQLSATSSYEYDAAGNIITQATGSSVTTYTYTNNSPNTANIGLNYYQQPKFLPDAYSYSASGTSITGTHTYTYDDKNRLIMDKQTITGSDADGYTIKRYTY